MVDFRKSVLHAHKEEVEEDVVDDEDEDDLDNENSLRSIEAKLDRALSDVSHLTVDNLQTSLSQSLGMLVRLCNWVTLKNRSIIRIAGGISKKQILFWVGVKIL